MITVADGGSEASDSDRYYTVTMGTIGIPVKLIHEAVGHVITVELKGGAAYRGTLYDAEDNFNIAMKDIAVTAPDGKQSHLENVYIRGNMLRFIIVPDMLQQAPMFKRIGPNAMKGRGIGSARGRATILRAQARRGRGGSSGPSSGGASGARPPIRR
ncbi:pre-mRNA splicing factor [Pseudozyma hubeiensis SY62]|uniref:Small nuclear ribonucleoprotein Sm D3 n=1 Tax=Pseudozyma hubeiensis (strain SY62) TaxID=1305764 RepID=R9PBT1_PSEHS|nr:pre-mRNA splicing factor [Pseudozyma hubeiensis SY62]GAC98848.1 pre-mRNA splicing factor [Pseudozyma hubeiensis SY62]